MIPGEDIATISVTATDSIVISTETNTDNTLQFMINPVTAEAIATGYFTVSCFITKDNGEAFNVDLRFVLKR